MQNPGSISIGMSRQLSASAHLVRVSLRRLLYTRQTAICAILLGFAAVTVWAWCLREQRTAVEFIEEIVLVVYVSFLLPIFCLSFATAGVTTEREEQTLVYLLVTPLPRPLVLLAKTLAAVVLAELWTVGGLYLLTRVAGPAGAAAWPVTSPAIGWSTLAYVALFSLFGVVFRRATLVALAYALFLEVLVGSMPGIAKRLAIAFYARCMIFTAGADLGVQLDAPGGVASFAPIAGPVALRVLQGLTAGLLLLAIVVFSRREYSR